ncbi:ATP-binding protein [Streptomyces sp. NPDC002917]|uniref:ATP-binding protein n=1 Tax=Streptomyces sp. NPDC002917 TaxID=3364671 RepID=UPI00369AE8BA
MSGEVTSFSVELRRLYEGSGVTLGELVRLGRRMDPSVAVSTTTISAWINGTQVPAKGRRTYFLAMVDFMGAKARGRGNGYVPLSRGRWEGALDRARAERDRNRGGRPATADKNPPMGPMTLPSKPAGFTGRHTQLTQIVEFLDPVAGPGSTFSAVSAIMGMGGVGKTALALEAAHQAWSRGWFPGGALFADLRGYSLGEPAEVSAVADQFLRDLGVKAKDVPSDEDGKITLWRSLLTSRAAELRPVLIVLDNALDSRVASRLRPDAPHRMLITSRQTLALGSSRTLTLAPLTPDEATALLDGELRTARADDERVVMHPQEAAQLATLCGLLPLALRIIAALLRDEPDRALVDQVTELADARTRLDMLKYYDDVDDQGRPLAVRAAINLSYQRLREQQPRAFRLLSCTPGGDISTEAASALLSSPPVLTRRVLTGLLRAHLLESPASERWSMHDLVQLFAQEQGQTCATEDERETALKRLLTHYIIATDAAQSHLNTSADGQQTARFPSRDAALGWLEQERLVLVAAATTASESGHPDLGYHLAQNLTIGGFLNLRRYLDDWVTVAKTALDLALPLNDPGVDAQGWGNYSAALEAKGDFAGALAALTQAGKKFDQVGDLAGTAKVATNRGSVLHHLGKYEEALQAAQDAQHMLKGSGHKHLIALAKHNEGLALRRLNRLDAALEAHASSASALGLMTNTQAGALAQDAHGAALREQGKLPEAMSAHLAAAETLEQLNDVHGLARALNHIGHVHALMNEPQEAVRVLSRAHRLLFSLDDPVGSGTVLFNRGQAHMQLEHIDEAIDDFGHAAAAIDEASRRTETATLLIQRGAALLLRGVALYQRAISLGNAQRFTDARIDLEEAAADAMQSAAAFRTANDQDQETTALELVKECQHKAQLAREYADQLAADLHTDVDGSADGATQNT